jgi:hypothetical protein
VDRLSQPGRVRGDLDFTRTSRAGTADCLVNNSAVSKSDLLRKLDGAPKARVTFVILEDRSALGGPEGQEQNPPEQAVGDTFFRLKMVGQDNGEVAWPVVYSTVTQTAPIVCWHTGGPVTIQAKWHDERIRSLRHHAALPKPRPG